MILVFFRGYGFWFSSSWVEIAESTSEFAYGDIRRIENMGCPEISGVFRLTKEDEITYLYTKSLSMVNKLLPCSHPDSAFSKFIEIKNQRSGLIVYNSELEETVPYSLPTEHYYFQIQKRQQRKKQLIDIPYILSVVGQDALAKAETIPNKTSIRKRHGVQRYRETLALLHTALDEIEQSTGITPDPEELVLYVLGGEFNHRNIQKRDPESVSIKRRKLYLTDGTTLDAERIKRRYKETIFPDKPE